jgi:hypothetical protein
MQVALQVRGVFADDRESTEDRTARKRAASVVKTGPQGSDLAPAQASGYKRVLDEGFRRIKEGDDSPDTYIATRKAQRRGQRRAQEFNY